MALQWSESLAREGMHIPLAQEISDLCVDRLVYPIKDSDRALGMYLKMKR
jgi:hypothetical protein